MDFIGSWNFDLIFETHFLKFTSLFLFHWCPLTLFSCSLLELWNFLFLWSWSLHMFIFDTFMMITYNIKLQNPLWFLLWGSTYLFIFSHWPSYIVCMHVDKMMNFDFYFGHGGMKIWFWHLWDSKTRQHLQNPFCSHLETQLISFAHLVMESSFLASLGSNHTVTLLGPYITSIVPYFY